jgi:hypothetical protein
LQRQLVIPPWIDGSLEFVPEAVVTWHIVELVHFALGELRDDGTRRAVVERLSVNDLGVSNSERGAVEGEGELLEMRGEDSFYTPSPQ